MIVKLIYPKGDAFSYKENHKGLWYPKLTFPVLAGYSPEEVEDIEIIDEEFEKIDFNNPVDLVGITAMPSNSGRAYEIADAFRERNVTVVLGGMHVSSLPGEALKHADSVVIGEGEDVWPLLIKDYLGNKLKPVYKAAALFDMQTYRPPRLDLLKKFFADDSNPGNNPYAINAQFEISRGCPYDCDFCSVTSFYGNKYRFRPLDKLIDNIRAVKLSLKTRQMGFVDDNLYGNKTYLNQLLKALPRLTISWFGQVSVNIVNNRDFIKMMADSGCKGLFIGFESLSMRSLESIHKKMNNIHQYQRLMDLLNEHKIQVMPSFMFGLDGDGPDIFEKTRDFLKPYRDSIAHCTFNLATPLPGTPFYKRMLAENRIIEHDWKYYDFNHVVIRPLAMSVKELQEGYEWIYREWFSLTSSGYGKKWQAMLEV